MNLTTKQKEILTHVIEANVDGSTIDMDQLLSRLSYTPTKQALHFSLRFLNEKGCLEKAGLDKRRGRSRMTIVPTALGLATAKGVTPLHSRAYVLSEADAELLSDLEAI